MIENFKKLNIFKQVSNDDGNHQDHLIVESGGERLNPNKLQKVKYFYEDFDPYSVKAYK